MEDNWFVLVLGLVGVGGLGYAAYVMMKVRQAASWPTAEGLITRSEVVTVRSNRGAMYREQIEYSYTVHGQAHTGEGVGMGPKPSMSWRSWAENRAARYKVGTTVTVFFDPERPERSCLDRRAEGVWILVLVSAFFITAAILKLFPR